MRRRVRPLDPQADGDSVQRLRATTLAHDLVDVAAKLWAGRPIGEICPLDGYLAALVVALQPDQRHRNGERDGG